ncbi:MAG: carboxypeptidase regulatory-like domain-containing protein [Acidobacteria bacterium]|nr:carboxypeptidase regulatory-like domain-containing protein [Acidobacteriota bacterium]
MTKPRVGLNSGLWPVLLLIAPVWTWAAGLSLDVESSSLQWLDDGAEITLQLRNDSTRVVPARVSLEILDPRDRVVIQAECSIAIASGSSQTTLPLAGFHLSDHPLVMVYRLRYRVEPEPGDETIRGVAGIAAFSRLQTPDLFDVHIIGYDTVSVGSRLKVVVSTLHPITRTAAPGVEVVGTLELSADSKLPSREARSVTDVGGVSLLVFEIPADLPADDARLLVEASRGAHAAKAELDISVARDPIIHLYTDKGLYQPGQTLHMRALAFDSSHRAIAGAAVSFKVTGPDDRLLFTLPVKTSRYGVASTDWRIPSNPVLGTYSVEFGMDTARFGHDAYRGTSVRVSRYDLPHFAITAAPDRTYYLPGQSADVTIEADYLFGQPVTTGQVRLTAEKRERWSPELRRWVTQTASVFEGVLDDRGTCTLRLDLGASHDSLAQNEDDHYQDLTFTASVTDTSTGRTERRFFDVRVSKEPIHLYAIDLPWGAHEGDPFDFFISSFEADGTPVSVEIAVLQSSAPDCSSGVDGTRLIRTVRTNRYGLAKVRGLVIPPSPCHRLVLESHDEEGRKIGHFEERLVFGTEVPIRLETDRTILRPGDPVSVRVSGPGSAVVVQVLRDLEIVRSQTALLRDGHATATFPWDPTFEGALYVVAYPPESTGAWRVDGTSIPIVYPSGSSLNLRTRLDRSTYRPGDEARVVFDLYQGSRTPVPGVLGVVAIDKALLEREDEERIWPSWTWEDSFAGISTENILRLDVRRPPPADLDLLAEILFLGNALPAQIGSRRFRTDAASEFVPFFEEKLASFRAAAEMAILDPPLDEQEGFRVLREAEAAIAGIVDPWGCPHRLRMAPHANRLVLEVETAGPDQQFATGDDFVALTESWYYFERPGRLIDRAFEEHHQRTGGFILDESTLAAEVSKLGLDLTAIRDPWGCPYEIGFEVSQTHYLIKVTSDGPDQRPASPANDDDIRVWTASIDSFRGTRQAIELALDSAMAEGQAFPATLAEFERVLNGAGLPLSNVCDPWDQPVSAAFSEQDQYGDATRIYAYSAYPDPPKRRIEIEPVTQRVGWIRMKSQGPDGLPQTQDDCEVASFSRVLSEQPAGERRRRTDPLPANAPGDGSIHGTVRDIDGRPVAAVYISAAREGLVIGRASTRIGGTYTLENLPAGLYEVCFERAGFTTILVDHVPVNAVESLRLDATLEVSPAAEVVTVTAESPSLDTKHSGVGLNQGRDGPLATSAIATPRLRQFFPETLVWEPSVETDERGRAELRFRLADNTTTWKLRSTASTEDGRMVTIDRDVLATLPFFVEQDPPRTLTQGDEISLPVGLHSDMMRPVNVELALRPEPWLKIVGSRVGPVQVLPRKPRVERLTFRAVRPVRNAPLRVTAAGDGVGDAVEKPVTVHPDGEEVVTTECQLLSGQAIMHAVVPDDALPGSVEAELVLYPNLIAQVAESAEGLLERPHGCAEQTASVAFVSLLLLRNSAQQAPEAPTLVRARRYVQDGYDRLLDFQQPSGGFSYWRGGEPDPALTAYVIRFLTQAQGVVVVDVSALERARDWLLKNQAADGRWPMLAGEVEDRNETLALTAMILRVIAETATGAADLAVGVRLSRGLVHLRDRLDEIPEPYALASYCLAALAVGDKTAASAAARLLSVLAHEEGGAAYWSLETNTPFYGRGVAGRIETTALAVQALAGAQAAGIAVERETIDRGVLFLFRHKDRLGVWSSTQATVNALEALLAQLSRESPASDVPGSSSPVDIVINGERLQTVDLATADFLGGISRIDIAGSLHAGENKIEIRGARPVPTGLARIAVASYRPWARPDAQSRADRASSLALAVQFDTTEAQTGTAITCHVSAERIGFKGYGMLLAEVGLPPGADVDRRSLEEARSRSDSSLSMYEIQPDHVVLYLWPEGGSAELTFRFRPRFAIKAKSAPSFVFEYYNPDARAVVPPVDFTVRGRSGKEADADGADRGAGADTAP